VGKQYGKGKTERNGNGMMLTGNWKEVCDGKWIDFEQN
jgi:hypothetical protein